MAVSVEDLAEHLGFNNVPLDSEALDRALQSARAVIHPQLLEAARLYPLSPAQQGFWDQAVLIVAGDMWRRKDSVGGVYQFADGTDTAAYLPKDPLAPVWPMLLSAGLIGISVA